jgi:hypothetical protein
MRNYKINDVVIFSNDKLESEIGKIVYIIPPDKNELEFLTKDFNHKLPELIPINNDNEFLKSKEKGHYIVECFNGEPIIDLIRSNSLLIYQQLDETKLYCVIFENQIEKI